MRVALVWNGPASAAERDPLARRQVPLLGRLEAQGVSIAVVLLGDAGRLRECLADAGVRVDVVPSALPPAASSLARMPAVVVALHAALRRQDVDLVEGDEPLPAIALGLAAHGRRRAPVVYRRHHAAGKPRLILASRLAARLADCTIVSCEAMRRSAAEQDRTRPGRILVATSGTPDLAAPPPSDLAATRRSLGIAPCARVIVVVSRLRREKGIDVLIESVDRVVGIGEVHAIVVGVGPEEAELRRLAARIRVPVHFVGHQQDVARWLAVADVVAMPSRRESFGRVTLETMAAGRPLVASRVGGLVEAVADGETGLLVPPENPPALAAALQSLLADPVAASRMGRAARQRYEARYTLDHMATSWREAWEAAVAGHVLPS